MWLSVGLNKGILLGEYCVFLLQVFFSFVIKHVLSLGRRRSGETASVACLSTRHATPSFALRRLHPTLRTGGTVCCMYVCVSYQCVSVDMVPPVSMVVDKRETGIVTGCIWLSSNRMEKVVEVLILHRARHWLTVQKPKQCTVLTCLLCGDSTLPGDVMFPVAHMALIQGSHSESLLGHPS